MMLPLFTRRVASDSGVIRLCQAACFAAAGLIPLLAFRKFAETEISEANLLLGVLATMSMALFYTTLGVVLGSKGEVA